MRLCCCGYAAPGISRVSAREHVVAHWGVSVVRRVDRGVGHSGTTRKVSHVTRVRYRAGTTAVAVVTSVGSAS